MRPPVTFIAQVIGRPKRQQACRPATATAPNG
jgi:hypothetical protein